MNVGCSTRLCTTKEGGGVNPYTRNDVHPCNEHLYELVLLVRVVRLGAVQDPISGLMTGRVSPVEPRRGVQAL